MKKLFEGFSVRKLLISILCTIIVTTSIGFTILFVPMAMEYATVEILSEVNEDSDTIKEVGYSMQGNFNQMKEKAEELKASYGDDYPAEGVLLFKITRLFRSSEIVRMYTMCLLIGTILGTLIYIIFVQKAKGSQMLLEAIVCGIVILILIALVNTGYRAIVNAGINDIDTKTQDSTYITYIYDIETHNVICFFIGIIGLAYIVNLIYQKILATKLNKKLNRK